ncbi:hypothetical protein ACFFRR_010599 [Megaselia abdita]
MSNWFNRIQSDLGSVVTSCGHPGHIYPYRLEKVKFGVSLDEVCKNDIPAPLLILILKLNKESANRRDVFRAPGHQGAMKKLIHFLQAGRLVNIENYSVYTIASVLKKFLRKIPNGIFSRNGEDELFAIIELQSENEQQERIHKLFASLPKYTQQLLVLLFGTFRVIATSAKDAGTGMSSEALGVSVAPSFFHSCVSDGKAARMEDVLKFKTATRIMKHIIDNFGKYDLFGRENYEYYSRITGRIVKVNDEWICSFRFPPPPRGKSAQQKYAQKFYLASEKTWLQCESDRLGIPGNIRLSNSAESVQPHQLQQHSIKRPPRRTGVTSVSRHHPHRPSRRSKDKSKLLATASNGCSGGEGLTSSTTCPGDDGCVLMDTTETVLESVSKPKATVNLFGSSSSGNESQNNSDEQIPTLEHFNNNPCLRFKPPRV